MTIQAKDRHARNPENQGGAHVQTCYPTMRPASNHQALVEMAPMWLEEGTTADNSVNQGRDRV